MVSLGSVLRVEQEGVLMHPTVFAFLGPIGLPELVIIFLIVVLIFGANRLSGLGRGMGQAIRGFKDEMGGSKDKSAQDPPHDA